MSVFEPLFLDESASGDGKRLAWRCKICGGVDLHPEPVERPGDCRSCKAGDDSGGTHGMPLSTTRAEWR